MDVLQRKVFIEVIIKRIQNINEVSQHRTLSHTFLCVVGNIN